MQHLETTFRAQGIEIQVTHGKPTAAPFKEPKRTCETGLLARCWFEKAIGLFDKRELRLKIVRTLWKKRTAALEESGSNRRLTYFVSRPFAKGLPVLAGRTRIGFSAS